jgi:type VI secretion system protein VasJ
MASWPMASDEARKLAGAGKLKEALAALQDGLGTCSQRRDRFLWRLTIARLCFEAGRQQLAAPLLEECREEIRRYHIQEWEPGLGRKWPRPLQVPQGPALDTEGAGA